MENAEYSKRLKVVNNLFIFTYLEHFVIQPKWRPLWIRYINHLLEILAKLHGDGLFCKFIPPSIVICRVCCCRSCHVLCLLRFLFIWRQEKQEKCHHHSTVLVRTAVLYINNEKHHTRLLQQRRFFPRCVMRTYSAM